MTCGVDKGQVGPGKEGIGEPVPAERVPQCAKRHEKSAREACSAFKSASVAIFTLIFRTPEVNDWPEMNGQLLHRYIFKGQRRAFRRSIPASRSR